MQSGPFATNPHVGWPSGFNLWSFPATSSLGFYLGAWFLGLVLDSSANVLSLLMGTTAAAVTAAVYWALRVAPPRPPSRLVSALGAVAMGLSPYVLSKLGHFNVAAWYLVPMVIAALAILQRSPTTKRRAAVLLLLVIGGLLSPLWWSLTSVYALLVGAGVALILRQWQWLSRILSVAGVVVVGAALPAALAIANRIPGGSWNRQPWDSTLYGGSLTDLLLPSPWLSRLSFGEVEIARALSRETSYVGIVIGIAALVAAFASISAFTGFGSRWAEHRWLFIGTQVVLLAFLSMGLGVVQEAILAIAGVESPLRVWSRLIIVIGLFGLIFTVSWASRWFRRGWRGSPGGRLAVAIAAVGVSAVILVETAGIQLMTPRTIPDQPETEAVAYLQQVEEPCPVVQLPVGTFPDFPMADGTPESITYFYRGFVPYLLDPQGYWSFGSPAGSDTDRFLRSLPDNIDLPVRNELADAGYCAILFDREYAEWLQRRLGTWHGLRVIDAQPQWENRRFSIFEL